MSDGKKWSMSRRIIHRSYKCLVVEYEDGERLVVKDVERIRWILTECESLVGFSNNVKEIILKKLFNLFLEFKS